MAETARSGSVLESCTSIRVTSLQMIHPDDIKGTGPKNANLAEHLRDLFEWAEAEGIVDPPRAPLWHKVKEYAQGAACHYGCGMRRPKPSPSNDQRDAPI